MANVINTGGGYQAGYDDGYADGHGKMKVATVTAQGGGDSYSDTVDTGGTAEKTVYYCLAGYKENSAHTVYISLLGSNENSSWVEIVKYNAVSGPYSNAPSVGSTNKSYRYYKIYAHRQSGGDREGGMIAVMAE